MSTSTHAAGLKIDSAPPVRRANPLRTAPNLLTLFRVLIAPFLVVELLERRFLIAFALFLVAATTDAMDGFVARWLRQRTRVGQYLDPIADKLMLSSLFLALTYMGVLQPHVAAIVFSRDLGMLLVAVILYAITDLRDFHPTFLGKANSFSQVVAIGLVLLSLVPDQNWDQPWVMMARAAAIDATMLLTVVSGFHYGWVVSHRTGVADSFQHLENPMGRMSLVLFWTAGGFLFYLHVPELVGVKDFAAFQAFDVFNVFLAGDDADSGVFARARHLRLDQFYKAFSPDCIEACVFVQERIDKDLRSIDLRRRKSAFSALPGRQNKPHLRIESPATTVVY